MAITITTQTVNGANVVIAEQSGGTGVAIAIDYSFLYNRIADTLDSIAANVASIKTSISNIDVNTTKLINYGTGNTETFIYSGSLTFNTSANLASIPRNQIIVSVRTLYESPTEITDYCSFSNNACNINSLGEIREGTESRHTGQLLGTGEWFVDISYYGKGIRTAGSYDALGAISLYKLYAEQGQILNVRNDVSEEKENQSREEIKKIIAKVEKIGQF